MANGSNNARFLSKIDSKSKSMILENIAKHYGISTQEAFSEVTDSEAEHLLDYMTEPARSAASVLMQAKGMRGFSRPGEKDMMATRKPKAREKWETVFYEYFDGVSVSIMDSAKIKNDINAILASGADLKVEMPKLVKKYGRFSRPGAKAKFKVEDRFYFGKGRKERFAENVTYSIAAHIGSQPVGHRSVDSLEQAKVYAKQMLEAFKPDAKGKPLLVEVYPVVNYSPQPAVLTLRG